MYLQNKLFVFVIELLLAFHTIVVNIIQGCLRNENQIFKIMFFE